MARSSRRAVKWVLLTTMLLAGGGGAFWYTGSTTRLAKLVGWHGADAELIADNSAPAPLTRSDLDAVATAWGGSSIDKYAAASARIDEQVAPAEFVAPVDAGGRYGQVDPAAEPTPAQLPAEEPHSVARGQEPEEASDATAADGDRMPNPFDAARGGATSSQRARDAFADSIPAPNGDRYKASAGEATPLRPEQSAGAINPFASAGATKEPTPAQTASAKMPINQPTAAIRGGDDLQFPMTDPPAAQPIRASRTPAGDLGAGTDFRSGSYLDPARSSRGAGLSGDTGSGLEGSGRPGERALEGPQKPALVIQKFAPPEIQVGKAAKFAIQVRNVGGQSAADVVIRDEVPHGTRLVSTTPKAEVVGSELSWNLGTLSTGEERTVEVQLEPISEGEIGSVANVTYSAQASVKSRCTMPQLAIRMTTPTQVMIGQEQRVKIELRNPGTGDATGVMLFETVPENVKHAAGPTLEFEIGTLRPNETRELELVLLADKAGHVINTLSARADGNLQVDQQVEFEVIAPDLQLSVTGPERRYLERPATYQVKIENPGTAPAHDVELVTKLPKGMKFVRANNLGEYDAATHSVFWSLAELPEGEQGKGSVELVVMPVEAGAQTLEVSGKASQGLTDETKQNVLVEGLAAIMFEVKDSEDPIEVGGETSYEIRVVNQGSKAATNVQVVVSLPPGMQVMSATGETRYSAQGGGVVFEPLAKLAPKADTVYRVQVKGVQAGDQRITVQVNTDDISQPIRREESTRVFGDE